MADSQGIDKAINEFKHTESQEQIVIDVKLIVKAPGKQEGENFVASRLGKWLQEEPPVIPGEGYPYGTLLWYKIQEKKKDE